MKIKPQLLTKKQYLSLFNFLVQFPFIDQLKQIIQLVKFMSNGGNRGTKIGWTVEEEKFLEDLCQKQKKSDWKYISCEINTMFPKKNRTPKQCRERFHNYIKYKRQNIQMSCWKPQEDEKLFRMYIEVGSKWAEISQKMPGRSENNIKNRFYGKLRKFVRVINEVPKNVLFKSRKPIKQEMIIKILSKSELQIPEKNIIDAEIREEPQIFLQKLKYDLLVYILEYQIQINQSILAQLLNRIHIYNSITKSENIKQNRMGKSNKRKRLPPFKIQFNNINVKKEQEQEMREAPQEEIKNAKVVKNKQQEEILHDDNDVEDLASLQSLQNSYDESERRAFNRELQQELSYFFQRHACRQKFDYFSFE